VSFSHKSTRWERKRAAILRRDEYLCQECKRYGKSVAASPVHHICPVESHPELAYADSNLISLCNKCHNEMHDRTTDQLTSKGLALIERINKYKENK